MNEKGKLKIVIVAIFAIIIAIVTTAIIENNNQKKKLESFNNYLASETEKIIYFYRDGCYYCQLFKPAKEAVLDGNNIDYYSVDTDSISETLLNKMLDKLGITQFGTPTLAVVKDNSVVTIQSGVFDLQTDNIEELAQFVTNNNVADLTEYIEEYKASLESE